MTLFGALLVLLAILADPPGSAPGVLAATNTRSAPPPPPPPASTARLQKLADVLVRPFAPVVPESAISAACRQHSQLYLRALTQLAPWAMHMYDASTKIPASIMAGNIQQLGNFDQCVSIRVSDADTGTDVFRGKHCTASVSFRMPAASGWGESALGDLLLAAANASDVHPGETSAPLDWALCVPSSCSPRDVELALAARLATLVGMGSGTGLGPGNSAASVKPVVSVAEDRCLAADSGRQNQPLQPKDIAFICLLLVTMYVIAASTTYDVLCTPYGADRLAGHNAARLSRAQELLVSFSLRRNGAALLTTARSGDTMGCLHGLRVLSITWVVLLHSFYNEAVSPNINRAVVPKLGDSLGNMVLLNATLATDTFFLLSGALLAVGFLRTAGPRAFNPLLFYWHRYVRITPVYAVMVWFYASLLVRLGSGPLWDRLVGPETDNCVLNWWTNLAYVNNFVDIGAPCMNQTWYLAVDMQLFWLSPLVLVPLVRWPRVGRAFLGVLVLLAVAVPAIITFAERLEGAMLYTKDNAMVGAVFVMVYTRVYNRAGPYLVGIALGCLLTAVRGRPLRLPAFVVILGWGASAVTCLSVLFGVFGFYQRWHQYSALEAALYAGLHRTAWAVGVAWVVFACVTGHGGPVNALLSWRPFAPLARLSYCVYLTHYAVIMVSYGLRRSPGYFNLFHTVQGAIGTLVMSCFIAAALSLAYEMPFMVLDRVLVPRGPATKQVPAMPNGCTIATVEDHKDIGRTDLIRGYDNGGFDRLSEK